MKVTSKSVETKIQGLDLQESFASRTSLDRTMIEMSRKLQRDSCEENFSKSIQQCYENISLDLRLCRHFLNIRDSEGLDKLSQQISQNALIIGASGILRRSVDMQELARLSCYSDMELVLQEIEHELVTIKAEILECS